MSMLPKKFRVSSGGRLLSLSVTRSARMAEGGVPLFPPVRLLPQFTCGAWLRRKRETWEPEHGAWLADTCKSRMLKNRMHPLARIEIWIPTFPKCSVRICALILSFPIFPQGRE